MTWDLDALVAFGNPNAVHCRWCGTHRAPVHDALLCPRCDPT